jgi:NADPH2:quinone reductase
MEIQMQALVLDQPGHPSSWRMGALPIPEPGQNEIRVKVHACGLNPADYKIGEWGNPAWLFPFVMGLDVAGVVDAVGENVNGWQVGDQVYYHGDFTRPGGFAEFTVIPARVVAKIPEGVTFVEAAAVPCSGFAAYQSIFYKLHLKAGETVLIQGASGGVGTFAVQLSALVGAKIIATTSQKNAAFVQSLGADYIIDYQTENVRERVFELTQNRGVDAIIDTVSQATTTEGLEMIAFGGQIACVDSLPDLSKVRPFAKALSIHEIALGVAHLSGDHKAQEELAVIGQELGSLIAAGNVKPIISEVISLGEVPQGLTKIAERHVRGKIVAQIR